MTESNFYLLCPEDFYQTYQVQDQRFLDLDEQGNSYYMTWAQLRPNARQIENGTHRIVEMYLNEMEDFFFILAIAMQEGLSLRYDGNHPAVTQICAALNVGISPTGQTWLGGRKWAAELTAVEDQGV